MQKSSSEKSAPDNQGGKLGTFAGVFTPSILTILGIILFLRLGFVVGHAGLGRTLIILALANGIYLASHNAFRGFPRAVIVGNFFRSVLSIPIAILFNTVIGASLAAGWGLPSVFLGSAALYGLGTAVAALVDLALAEWSLGVAFTYSEPLVWFEYVKDTATLSRARGLKNVLVTNGYLNPEPLAELLPLIDAANIDLKSFRDDFYRNVSGGRLEPVLDTLRYLHEETDVWFETPPFRDDYQLAIVDGVAGSAEVLFPDVLFKNFDLLWILLISVLLVIAWRLLLLWRRRGEDEDNVAE